MPLRTRLLAGTALMLIVAASQPSRADGPGVWSNTISLPNVPVSIALLPNGKILTWAANSAWTFEGDVGTSPTSTVTSLYTLRSGTITSSPDTGMMADMFCSGISFLPDGRLLVNGGSSSGHTGIYDSATNRWTGSADMNIARGYNSSVTLSTGDVFTIGGSWSGDGTPKDGEVWSAATGTWRQTAISVDAVTATDDLTDQAQGYIEFGDNHAWLFAMPNGRVFHAGPSPQMNWFDPANDGSTPAGLRGDDAYSINGVAVMYAPGKIFKSGGALTYTGEYDPINYKIDASNATYLIDVTQDYTDPTADPVVRKLTPLHYARTFANAVVLPDGEVFVVGGQSRPHIFYDTDSVMTPEIWNPATEQSIDVAPLPTPRNYHSTAVLLPDARVFVGGGGLCGDGCDYNHNDFEIYSPPYLFSGPALAARPVITSAPPSLALGNSLVVSVDREVASFVLIRMAATTHVINTDQRRIPLTIQGVSSVSSPNLVGGSTVTTQYTLAVPADPGITVPGLYMLFALTGAGVPSVAPILTVASP